MLSFQSNKATVRWMQVSTPLHCTNEAKVFMLEKFNQRVISQGTHIVWPVHSFRINPFVLHFNNPDFVQCVRAFVVSDGKETMKTVSVIMLMIARL